MTNTPTQTAANQLISQYHPLSLSLLLTCPISFARYMNDGCMSCIHFRISEASCQCTLFSCCRLFWTTCSYLFLFSFSRSCKQIITSRLSYSPVIRVSADFVLLELLPVSSRDLSTHLFLAAYRALFHPSSVVRACLFWSSKQTPSYISMSDETDVGGDPAQCQSFLLALSREAGQKGGTCFPRSAPITAENSLQRA